MRFSELKSAGDTRLEISEMGFGGAPLGNMHRALSEEEAQATLRAAIDAGVTYFGHRTIVRSWPQRDEVR